MPRPPRLSLPLSAALVCACGPDKSDSMTEATSTASTTSPASTTVDASTTDVTTNPTGEPSCSPGPVDGDLDCVPPGDTRTSWQFLFDGAGTDAFDAQCTVSAVSDDGSAQLFGFLCPDGPATLELTTTDPHVPLDLVMGATVRLRYTPDFDGEVVTQSFTLLDDTEALLAAGLERWVKFPIALDALDIALRSTDCDGSGDEFDCFVIQRAGVEVTRGDQSAIVFGGNTGTLGDLQFLVNDSTREVCFGIDPECGYNYSPFSTSALFLRAPGG